LGDHPAGREPETNHGDNDGVGHHWWRAAALVHADVSEVVSFLRAMHATLSGWSRFVLRSSDERGFTLAEMMVAMALMLIVCGAVTSALIQMTGTQRMIFNRTQMHSGVRGAT